MSGPERAGSPGRARSASLAVLASFLVLSAWWSWPMAALWERLVPTRQLDLYPSVWLLDRVGRTLAPHAELSAWPVGDTLARTDSYVLLALAWLLSPVLDGLSVARVVAWLGPAVSAWAAERCAHLGYAVPRPWSWLAGVAFGFSGIAATALLEGHVYHLLAAPLPLLVLALRRAEADGDVAGLRWLGVAASAWRHGATIGLWWTLSLLTTAYFGILASGLLLVLGLRARLWRCAPGAAALILPVTGLYALQFAQGGQWMAAAADPRQVWEAGSASLATLAGWGDAVDLHLHSIGAPLGFTVLGLFVLSPLLLGREHGWRMLAGVALIAVVVSLGPTLRVNQEPDGRWWPARLLLEVPGASWFRFPVRVLWLWGLCAGLVAARVAAALAEVLPRWALAPLFACAVADLYVGHGLRARLGVQSAVVPSAYAAAPEGRAVLDLYPEAFDRDALELELHARALGCFHAATHGRPTLDACIRTSADTPREVVQEWLWPRLYAAEGADTAERLADLGVGAVALHELYFRETDRAALVAGLEALLGPRAARSQDGGEVLSLWVVPARDGALADAVRAREAYAALVHARSAPPARPLPPPLPPPR